MGKCKGALEDELDFHVIVSTEDDAILKVGQLFQFMAQHEYFLDSRVVASPDGNFGEAGNAHGEDDTADEIHDGWLKDGANKRQDNLIPNVVNHAAVVFVRFLYHKDPLTALDVGRILPHGRYAALEERIVLVNLGCRGVLQLSEEVPESL